MTGFIVVQMQMFNIVLIIIDLESLENSTALIWLILS